MEFGELSYWLEAVNEYNRKASRGCRPVGRTRPGWFGVDLLAWRRDAKHAVPRFGRCWSSVCWLRLYLVYLGIGGGFVGRCSGPR